MESLTERIEVFISYGDGSGDGSGYGGIKSYNCKSVCLVDGIQTIITAVKGNLAKGYIVNRDLTLTSCYIAENGNKFAHGKTLKEATVTRYHEDEYSEKAAVEAVVKKLFGEDEKEEEKTKFFTGRAVWVGENTRWHTKGKIYVFENGIHIYDDGTENLTSYAEDEMPQSTGFLPIVE